jgi:predicted esterase
VVCSAEPEQTYALYLPAQYSGAKRWPIVYAFDPAARGNQPVELMKQAAERYGYIVAGSNNSRNGPWKPQIDAAQAMVDDTRKRFSLDDRRIYFAGFSGGARVASRLGQQCHCAAGVFLNGAGFAIGAWPSRDALFAVFAAVGEFDFNYAELSQLDEKLEQAGFPHRLRHFDGPHEWAPANVTDEAFAWFRLVAMKEDREPRDEAFIASEKDAAASRVRAFEQANDPYSAWREALQAAAVFEGLAEATEFPQAAAWLAQQKAVRDGVKREKQDFQEQERLTSDMAFALDGLRDPAKHNDALTDAQRKIANLRELTEHEKRAERQRVYRRALAGLFTEFMEAGGDRLTAGQLNVARDYFELAADAQPDSLWALSNLAAVRSMSGDRKGTFEALRRAKQQAHDAAAFSAWLKQELAFAKLRDDAEFRSLLGSP